jgi:hypothetical protein
MTQVKGEEGFIEVAYSKRVTGLWVVEFSLRLMACLVIAFIAMPILPLLFLLNHLYQLAF